MSDIRFNGGYNNCNDRMAILKNSVVSRRLDENTFSQLSQEELKDLTKDKAFIYVDGGEGKDNRVDLLDVLHPDHVNADWKEKDESNPAFIKNKPSITGTNLDEDVVAYRSVGGVKAGDIFTEGYSLMEIIKQMLSLSPKYYISYGKSSYIPKDIPSDFIKYNATKESLLKDGLVVNYGTLKNEYYMLVISHTWGLKVRKIVSMSNGWTLDYIKDTNFANGTCDLYTQDLPVTTHVTGDETEELILKYYFEEETSQMEE